MDPWKADQNVVAMVYKRIDDAFPELTELKDGRIAVLMHEKAKEKNGRVEYGTLKKAPPLLALLTDKVVKYQFVLSIAADRWTNNLDDAQRMAVIDHHLCGIVPRLDETTNEVKYDLHPPNVQMYTREVEIHGIWWPDSELVQQMFSKWMGPVSKSPPVNRTVGIAPPSFPTSTPGPKLPPKKSAAKAKPRDEDGDLEGDDLDLPFVDGPSLTN